MSFTQYLHKFLNAVVSVKFFVIMLSTAMFVMDKLSENGWIMMVLTTTGLRLFNEMGAIVKDVQMAKHGAARAKGEEPATSEDAAE